MARTRARLSRRFPNILSFVVHRPTYYNTVTNTAEKNGPSKTFALPSGSVYKNKFSNTVHTTPAEFDRQKQTRRSRLWKRYIKAGLERHFRFTLKKFSLHVTSNFTAGVSFVTLRVALVAFYRCYGSIPTSGWERYVMLVVTDPPRTGVRIIIYEHPFRSFDVRIDVCNISNMFFFPRK